MAGAAPPRPFELELLYCVTNNGDIRMGVRKAAELLGCSVNYVRKMFAELEAKGFARPARRGSFGWKVRHSTTWVLTRYEHANQPATSDFMRWPEPPKKQNTVSSHDTVGITGRYRDGPETPPTVSPHDTVKADSAAPTVSPHDTRIVYHSDRSSARPVKAPPGSQRQKAAWLRAHLESGTVTSECIAGVLSITPKDVEAIKIGKIGLAVSAWEKLAALVAGRLH